MKGFSDQGRQGKEILDRLFRDRRGDVIFIINAGPGYNPGDSAANGETMLRQGKPRILVLKIRQTVQGFAEIFPPAVFLGILLLLFLYQWSMGLVLL